eukprot:6190280-Pleurochrysis_carterae.AAC.2
MSAVFCFRACSVDRAEQAQAHPARARGASRPRSHRDAAHSLKPPHAFQDALRLCSLLALPYLTRVVFAEDAPSSEGHVDGWDDPRMPTLVGLRFYLSAAEFILRRGDCHELLMRELFAAKCALFTKFGSRAAIVFTYAESFGFQRDVACTSTSFMHYRAPGQRLNPPCSLAPPRTHDTVFRTPNSVNRQAARRASRVDPPLRSKPRHLQGAPQTESTLSPKGGSACSS